VPLLILARKTKVQGPRKVEKGYCTYRLFINNVNKKAKEVKIMKKAPTDQRRGGGGRQRLFLTDNMIIGLFVNKVKMRIMKKCPHLMRKTWSNSRGWGRAYKICVIIDLLY